MNNAIVWTTLGVLAFACAPAQADGTANASLVDLHLELIDLAPGDGIAPTVTFPGPNGGSFVGASTYSGAHSASGAQAFDPLSVAIGPLDGYGAAASIAGDIFAGNLSLQASSYSSNVQVGAGDATALLYYDEVAQLPNLPFTLSAHTRLVVSGDGSVAVTATEVATDQSWAEVFLGLTDSLEDAIAGINTDDDILSVLAGLQTQHPGADALHRPVSVAFDNIGDDPRTGLFTVGIFADAVTVHDAASVPEPGTAALMLVAMGLLGATRRAFPVRAS